jgi:primosomal protein N' (replication factor Y) (superfamily II helicase)
MIAEVALNIPHNDPFDYLIPKHLDDTVIPGVRVLVSVNQRRIIGIVVKLKKTSQFDKLKSIEFQIDQLPVYDQRMLDFTKWMADYYVCSWGIVLDSALPTGLKPKLEKTVKLIVSNENFHKLSLEEQSNLRTIDGSSEKDINKEKGLNYLKKYYQNKILQRNYQTKGYYNFDFSEEVFELNEIGDKTFRKNSKADLIVSLLISEEKILKQDILSRVDNSQVVLNRLKREKVVRSFQKKTAPPDHFGHFIIKERFLTLNREQEQVHREIIEPIEQNRFKTFLLHGVTSSGKTEIYLHAVRKILQLQKTALILLPEISLTPQAVKRFKDRFGETISVLHSGMAEKARCKEWWKIKHGYCPIVVGARSAIFAPLKNIGLIVVDEEHDGSYKQQESPYYNARDAAVMIGAREKAVVVLGTATPAQESYFNAESSKYKLLTIKSRANQQDLPKTEIISLKDNIRQKGVFYLSSYLVALLKQNLQNQKQALIFLNRRGYAAFLSCTGCETPVICNNCSIAMTWHKSVQQLRCHHCGYMQYYPKSCRFCGNLKFRQEGIGTQRVERDLKVLFPKARFLRMDRDTISKKGALENNIKLINENQVDFIVGTQLISKGHDFKNIGLVCIVLADMTINIPDFRSSERGFQLMSQVSGRAGRSDSGGGIALIQTYNPEHYAIQSAISHDYVQFYKQEREIRKLLNNPPYTRLILIKLSDENLSHVEETAKYLVQKMRHYSEKLQFEILGPIESPIQKVNRRFYWQILIKGKVLQKTKVLLKQLLDGYDDFKIKGNCRITIDVDPI